MIIKCKEDGSDLFCKSAAERPGAHFDGALLTVPITSDIGDALAKQSAFKYAYFIQEIRKFPMPGARDPYGSDLGDISPEPVLSLGGRLSMQFCPVGRISNIQDDFARDAAVREHLRADGLARRAAASADHPRQGVG